MKIEDAKAVMSVMTPPPIAVKISFLLSEKSSAVCTMARTLSIVL